MRAMVLAAGLGNRLQPLTSLLPKSLVPILNRALLDYTLQRLRQYGITGVMINLHHLPWLIPQRYGDGAAWGLQLCYSQEPTLLGTAGALRKIASFWETEPLLVIHGDVLLDIDLTAFIRFHQDRKSWATLALIPYHPTHGYGAIWTDEQGRIEQFLEVKRPHSSPQHPCTFTGVQILEPSVQDLLPARGFSLLTETVYPVLLRENLPFWGYATSGYWSDVGTPARYLQTHFDLLSGLSLPLPLAPVATETPCARSPESTLTPPLLLGRNVRIGRRVRLGPFVVVGDNCHIGDEVTLSSSVLWDRVVLERGAVVQESILGSRVSVPARSKVSRAVKVISEGS